MAEMAVKFFLYGGKLQVCEKYLLFYLRETSKEPVAISELFTGSAKLPLFGKCFKQNTELLNIFSNFIFYLK